MNISKTLVAFLALSVAGCGGCKKDDYSEQVRGANSLYWKEAILPQFDKNKDGKVDLGEMLDYYEVSTGKLVDQNGDGIISFGEGRRVVEFYGSWKPNLQKAYSKCPYNVCKSVEIDIANALSMEVANKLSREGSFPDPRVKKN